MMAMNRLIDLSQTSLLKNKFHETITASVLCRGEALFTILWVAIFIQVKVKIIQHNITPVEV